MNRRGMVYTLVTVLLLLVVGSLFFARASEPATKPTIDRVLSVDKFIDNLGADSERAAYIAGYRAMIAMEQRLTESGEFFVDADAAFKEIFLTGTLAGQSFEIMGNSSFTEYLTRVSYEAGKQGISVNATVTNLSLYQEEPWSILVNYTIEMNVSDDRGGARWERTEQITGKVPIVELRDPLFSWGTLSRVQREIRISNVTQLVDDAGDANDTTGLMMHFNESFYIARGRGPNIIMRFEGDLSDDEMGFESLVDKEEIIAQGIAANETVSIVDYKYFSGIAADACDIQNVPDDFVLDDEDLVIYGIEGNLEYSSC